MAPPTTLVSVSSASVAAGGSPAGGSTFGTGTPTGADGGTFSGAGEGDGSGVVAAGPWEPKAGAGAVGPGRRVDSAASVAVAGRCDNCPCRAAGSTPREAAAVVVRRRAVVASCRALDGSSGTADRRATAALWSARAGAISMATTGTSATVALAPISPSLPRPPRAIERRNGARVTTLIAATPLRTMLKPRRQVAASTEEERLDRSHAQLELIGDLRVGETLPLAQEDAPALALGKLREPVTERLEPLAPLVAGRLGRGELVDVFDLLGDGGETPARPPGASADVERDLEQPRELELGDDAAL